MLKAWVEDDAYTTKMDILLHVIYKLRMADKESIKMVTGWQDTQIRGALNRIREWEKVTGEKWLLTWRPAHRAPYVYTLREKGIEHVKARKDDALGFEESELTIRGQVGHFMGTNRILTRALTAQVPVVNFYSQKDTMSHLFYQMRPRKSPVNPDGMLKLPNETFFLEYDTGSENGGRIEGKTHRYLMLAAMVGSILPILFVTPKASRTKFISGKITEATNTFVTKMKEELKKRKLPLKLPDKLPQIYSFTEGEEVAFLKGAITVPSLLAEAKK